MHKIKVTFFIFLSLRPCGVVAQLKLKIISGIDSSQLPYATISNFSKQQIYSTNEHGEIELNATRGDTFQISYVGYRNADCIFVGDKDKTVILYRNEGMLKPVIVSTCNKVKKITLKNFEKDKKRDPIAGFIIGNKGLNEKGKIALLIENSKNNTLVKKFSFWLKKEFSAPDISILNPLIICFYEVEDLSNYPGRMLLKNPLFIFPDHEGKQTIDLDSLHIIIPESGMYVSFQYILDEKYEWDQHLTSHMGSGDTTVVRFGGIIQGEYNAVSKVAYYNGVRNEWFIPVKAYGHIKYEIDLEYCDD